MDRTRLAAAAVFGLAAISYLLTLCPSVYVEGSGELIGAVWGLGTPHPTGYPLYVLLAKVLSWLDPGASPARAVNAATCLLAAAAAGSLALLLRARGCGWAAAAAAGLALAWSRTYWSQAVIAEVYGLFVLAAVVLLGAGLRARSCPPADRPRWLLLTGYAAGLAATCHLQAVLLVPPVLVAALGADHASVRRGPRERLREAAWLVPGGLAGVSAWIYLPVRNGLGAGFHWGPLDSLPALWEHLTGATYRGSFFSLPWGAAAINARRLGEQLAGEWTPLFLPLLAWGAVAAWRRDPVLARVLLAAAILNLVTALGYHRNPQGLDVFFLLAVLCAAALAGFGLDDLVRRLRGRLRNLAPAAVLACAAVPLAANLGEADRSGAWFPDLYGRRLLEELPPRAVLVTEGDDASFLVDYLRRVEGVRPDVTIANRLGRGDPTAAGGREGAPRRRRRELAWMNSERPVHFLVARRPPEGFRFEPRGLSYLAVRGRHGGGPDTSADPAGWLEGADPALLDSPDPWVRKLVANGWFMSGERHRAAAEREMAAAAYRRAAESAPGSQSMNYNVSLMLFRMNELEESLRYALRALEIDPVRTGPYRLAAQVLSRMGRAREAEALRARAREWARAR